MVEYKNVFQTDRDPAPEAEARWNKANGKDGWSVDFYDDARAQSWMEETFGGSDVEWAWDFMKRGVLRADFLRYMLPLVKGGVYVDVDVSDSMILTQVCSTLACRQGCSRHGGLVLPLKVAMSRLTHRPSPYGRSKNGAPTTSNTSIYHSPTVPHGATPSPPGHPSLSA